MTTTAPNRKHRPQTYPCGCGCGRALLADQYTAAEFALDVRFWSTILLFSTEKYGNHPLVEYGDMMSDALLDVAHGMQPLAGAPPVAEIRRYLSDAVDNAANFRTELLNREFPPLTRLGGTT